MKEDDCKEEGALVAGENGSFRLQRYATCIQKPQAIGPTDPLIKPCYTSIQPFPKILKP